MSSPNFAFRLDPLDKAMLKELATRLKRSQVQTIRDLVREALAVLKEQDAQKTQVEKTIVARNRH